MTKINGQLVFLVAWTVGYTSYLYFATDWIVFIPVTLIQVVVVAGILCDSRNSSLRKNEALCLALKSLAVTGLVIFFRYIGGQAYCYKFECCRQSWIPMNVTGKKSNLYTCLMRI